MPTNELVVVGTGIQAGRDFSAPARFHVKSADRVFFLAADPIAAGMIADLNPAAESLHGLYDVKKPRLETYANMVDRIMSALRGGDNVCVVAYGHPGLFAYPTHKAIEQARREGFRATMLPAVSSVDCLFADLGIDPATHGLQIYDASHFVLTRRTFDTTTALVLLQIDVVGEPGYRTQPSSEGLALLVERLAALYGAEHSAVVYAASEFPWCEPVVQHVTVGSLARARVGAGSSLFVPAKAAPPIDAEISRRVGELLRASTNH